jgi:AGZA family xanthine/uracil permease-like MFS transporter
MQTRSTDQSAEFKPKLWVPGDWNAFFGLGTNVLLNVLVLSALVLFVIKLPNDIVFGRILPALGIALPIGNLYYAYLAYRLAKREGRDDVAAMPYGPSVPHYFFVTFVIMLPVVIKTNGNVLQAWEAGLAWAFFIGVVVLIGAFIGPTIRRFTPRATTTTFATSSWRTAREPSSARSSAAPSRRPCTSAIRAGRPSADGSAIRWPPASSSR